VSAGEPGGFHRDEVCLIAQTAIRVLSIVRKPWSATQLIDLENRDWRSLAEQVSTETNPSKMTLLVDQLCAAFDRKESETVRPAVRRGTVALLPLRYDGSHARASGAVEAMAELAAAEQDPERLAG
jgi:hypothetical protein